MLERVLRFSIRQRGLVVLVTVGMAVLGAFQFTQLPIDAVPDITNVQVQVNTVAEGFSPEEVEKQVSVPVEASLAGLPGLIEMRSLSRYGLSQITVVFRDGTNIYFARQLVNERIQEARSNLGPGAEEPVMGPIATGLGEIFMWTIETQPGARKSDGTPYTSTDLREIQDWIVKPQLRTIPGVTEINTIGGYRKQYHVTPDPSRLVAYGLTFHDIELALENNNAASAGGYIEHKAEQYLVRSTGRLETEEDLRDVVVATREGVPIRVRDLAMVGQGKELRTGAATENGEEVVLGTAFMLIGENSRRVSQRVAKRLEEVNKTLPAGVLAKTIYDRTKLVDATLHTVRTNLFEGAVLVIVILFALLGNFTAAVLVALIIPLSMLFAATGMVYGQISANLLSLGAIDFGIIVDGAVVMVENIIRRFGERQHQLGRRLDVHERLHESFAASAEVARPTLFGMAIIMIVYLPILTLTGIEGKMFRPMAQVVLLALAGALLLAFTFVPAMVALVLRGRVSETESPVIRVFRRAYLPTLGWALNRRKLVVALAVVMIALVGVLTSRMGSEFMPSLDEHDIATHAMRIPGTSLRQAVAMQNDVEKTIKAFPEVAYVVSKIGTAEIATDPMPPNVADVLIMLKPRHDWPDPKKPKPTLVRELEAKLGLLPGNVYEFTQPIQMRFNELIAGVRSDVAVKVFGDDLETLLDNARDIERVLKGVPGAADVKVEQVSGLPMLTVDVQRAVVARYGLNVRDVQDVVRTALAGSEAGSVYEGDRRFEIVVRLPEHVRSDPRALAELPVPVPARAHARALPSASGEHDRGAFEFVPLGTLATITVAEGPNQISRENGKRRVVVQANVRGRDIGSFVAEAERRIAAQVTVPPGYWLTWGGQFENLRAARTRLAIVVPIALLLILLLLFAAFGSVLDALIVFSGVPLALTGGIIALAARGLPISISAGIGFIALSGVAVLNGVVMVSFVRSLRQEGMPLDAALREGCSARLRPILMTALVASLGFVPMAIATGTGAEVQRPLATVVIGGIISSTLLTLVVLPALYRLLHRQVESPLEP